MADAAFLGEVEDFLALLDVQQLPLVPDPERMFNRGQLLLSSDSDSVLQQQQVKTGGRRVDPATQLEQKRAKDRKRRANYRERRQIERTSLLQQVVELTAELAMLKKPSVSMPAAAWKLLAQRQRQARLNAEAQQRRLCAEVDARAALIQDVCSRVSEVNDSGEFFHHKRNRLEPSDAELLGNLLSQLDGIYARTDEVLCAQTADDQDGDWGRSRTEDLKTGNCICAYQIVMPVEFKQACPALWGASQLPHQQNDRLQYDQEPEPDNSTAFRFRVTTRFETGKALSMTQYCVSRRYEHGDRLVIVWKTLLEGEGEFAGLHVDESGWTELTRAHANGSLMRTCIEHVPMHFSSVATHEPVVKQFTDAALDCVFEDGVEILKLFDNIRLTEA